MRTTNLSLLGRPTESMTLRMRALMSGCGGGGRAGVNGVRVEGRGGGLWLRAMRLPAKPHRGVALEVRHRFGWQGSDRHTPLTPACPAAPTSRTGAGRPRSIALTPLIPQLEATQRHNVLPADLTSVRSASPMARPQSGSAGQAMDSASMPSHSVTSFSPAACRVELDMRGLRCTCAFGRQRGRAGWAAT